MPSESGLMRTFYTADLANKYPSAKIIIAMPEDTSKNFTDIDFIKKELRYKIDSNTIILKENKGTNTRSQALHIAKFDNSTIIDSNIVIVTSPEHLYRAILVFKKVGFKNVSGLPTFENALQSEISFSDEKLGGKNSIIIPNIGKSITFRYQFWNHLKYELIVLREYCAICFYWIKDWI